MPAVPLELQQCVYPRQRLGGAANNYLKAYIGRSKGAVVVGQHAATFAARPHRPSVAGVGTASHDARGEEKQECQYLGPGTTWY